MSVKKTFRLTEYRQWQLETMSQFLKDNGYKGTQTEVIEKAIMEMYFSMRRTNLDYFHNKEQAMGFHTDQNETSENN